MNIDARHIYRVSLVVLLAAVAAVYWDVLGYGYLSGFDDRLYVIARPEVKSWWDASWQQRLLTPDLGYPVPIPTGIYAFARWLTPEAFPQYLHGLNLALHLANVSLVLAIATRWLEDWRLGMVVAAVWGLHPVCVESVAWLTDLKVLVFAVAALTAMLVAESVSLERDEWFGWRDLAVIGCLVVGLGARPEALVIPGLVWLVYWRRSDAWTAMRQVAVVAGTTLAIAAVYLPVAMGGQADIVSGMPADPMAPERLFVRVSRALEISARNVVWPLWLDPGYFRSATPKWPQGLPGLGILVGGVLAVAYAYRSGYRRITAAMLVAAAAYLPYSQLKPLPRLTADTYMYLPLVGLVIAAAAIGQTLLEYLVSLEGTRRRRLRNLFAVCLGGWMALTTFISIQQVDRWKNTQRLWIPYAERHISNWKPFVYAGQAYVDIGEYELAASTYDHGLFAFRVNRHYPPMMIRAYEEAGAPKRAWKVMLEAIERAEDPDPTFFKELLRFLAAYEWADIDELSDDTIRRAVKLFAGDPNWMGLDGVRRRLMIMFAAAGRTDMASRFIEWELERVEIPNCAVWVARTCAPSNAHFAFPIPEEPTRCEGLEPPDGVLDDGECRGLQTDDEIEATTQDLGGEIKTSPQGE